MMTQMPSAHSPMAFVGRGSTRRPWGLEGLQKEERLGQQACGAAFSLIDQESCCC